MNTHHEDLADRMLARSHYFKLRGEHPSIPAGVLWRIARSDGEGSGAERGIDQLICYHTTGHDFRCTGTLYGGDDERWGGEGRCFCRFCGADGDA